MAENELDIVVQQDSTVPLYEQICEQIRQKIESRQLPPGAQLPTSHELCARLQINYKTAHQAMATLAKEGYVTRQARRGTVVKGIPRRGVVAIYSFPDYFSLDGKHEYYRLIMGHLGRLLENHGRVHRQYLGSDTPETPNLACDDLLKHLVGGMLCGVLLVKPPQNMEELVAQGRALHVPVVALLHSGLTVDYSVSVDFLGFVRSAAQHLYQQGSRRIGVIFNSPSYAFRDLGLVAESFEQSGCTAKSSWMIGHAGTEEGGYEAAVNMPLAELDGLIIKDDVMALGVERRLRELNVNVPRDLKVATFWNRGSRLSLTLPFERFEMDVERLASLGLQLMQDVASGQRITEPHLKISPIHQSSRQLEQEGS